VGRQFFGFADPATIVVSRTVDWLQSELARAKLWSSRAERTDGRRSQAAAREDL
jgi:hypothetical protein